MNNLPCPYFLPIFGVLLGCSTVPDTQHGSNQDLSIQQHMMIQKRLDIFVSSQSKELSHKPLQPTIFLHGAGMSSESLLPIFLPAPGSLYIFPDAPYAAFGSAPFGTPSYIHWPRNDRLAKDQLPVILQALEIQSENLKQVIEKIQHEYRCTDKVNIVGISQGGVLAYHFLLTYPDLIGKAVFAFTPTRGLIPKDKEANFLSSSSVKKPLLKVLLIHHRDDPSVAFDNSMDLQNFFAKASVPTLSRFSDSGGHALSEQEISELNRFLCCQDHVPTVSEP